MTRYASSFPPSRRALRRTVAASFVLACASTALAQSPASDTHAAASAVSPSVAAAPARSAAPQRGYITVNGVYQTTSNGFTNQWSTPYYLETQSINASYAIKGGAAFDAGAGVRVWRDLTVGGSVSRYHRSEPASLTASVPNPLLYQQPRNYSGTVDGTARTETAVHVNAMWLFGASSKVGVAVFGGPSIFNIQQAMVSGMTFTEAYPYTTLAVAKSATLSEVKSKVGYNAGCDVTVLLHKQVGVGMLIRYAGIAGEVPPPTVSGAPDTAVAFGKAGGLQVGGGLRVRF